MASRLQRWAYFLSRFSYDIEYIRSESNGNCDALSRLPVDGKTPVFDNEFIAINYVEEALETLNAAEIAKETKCDKILSKVLRYVNDIWPRVDTLNGYEQKLYVKRDELTVEKGCLLWGYRVIVPESYNKVFFASYMHRTSAS